MDQFWESLTKVSRSVISKKFNSYWEFFIFIFIFYGRWTLIYKTPLKMYTIFNRMALRDILVSDSEEWSTSWSWFALSTDASYFRVWSSFVGAVTSVINISWAHVHSVLQLCTVQLSFLSFSFTLFCRVVTRTSGPPERRLWRRSRAVPVLWSWLLRNKGSYLRLFDKPISFTYRTNQRAQSKGPFTLAILAAISNRPCKLSPRNRQ